MDQNLYRKIGGGFQPYTIRNGVVWTVIWNVVLYQNSHHGNEMAQRFGDDDVKQGK